MGEKSVRVWDRPEDYAALSLQRDKVELSEDGLREWWYFDAALPDGTVVVVQFQTGAHIMDGRAHPTIIFQVLLPDGTKIEERRRFRPGDCTHTEGTCGTYYAGNYFRGDLTDYEIHISGGSRLACNIRLHTRSTPFRPGTGYLGLGRGGTTPSSARCQGAR